MLDNVGLRYPHRASGAKAPRTLRPLPLLRFAVSATGGAHLCSIQYYLRFWLSICRTSLAVSALRIMRYCLSVAKGACLAPHGLARAFLFLLSAILILAAGSHPSPAFAGAPLKGEPISYFRFAMDAKRPEGWFSATNLKTSAPLGPGTVKTVPYRLFYCAQRAINAYLTHRGAHCAPADVCLIAGWRNMRNIR